MTGRFMPTESQESDLGNLNPRFLGSPLCVKASVPESTVVYWEFLKILRLTTQNGITAFNRKYLHPYRILEWEFFVLDLARSAYENILQFDFGSSLRDLPNTRDSERCKALLTAARSLLLTSEAKTNSGGVAIDGFDRTEASFVSLAKQHIVSAYPMTFRRVFHLVGNNEGSQQRLAPILIHDGELTFYSLLWLLRRTDPNSWCNAPHERREVEFIFEGGQTKWNTMDLVGFAEMCGIAVKADNGAALLTPRWHSMVAWLDGKPRNVALSKEPYQKFAESVNTVVNAFPKLENHDLCAALISFASAIKEVLDVNKPDGSAPDTCGTQSVAASAWNGHDHALFTCCRAPFFPWEFLLRAWQPYPLHLLIVPVGPVESPILEDTATIPHTVAFATIAGQVPAGEPTEWTVPYVELLSTLGQVWAYDALAATARKIREARKGVSTTTEFLQALPDPHNGLEQSHRPLAEFLGVTLTDVKGWVAQVDERDSPALACLKALNPGRQLTVLGAFFVLMNACARSGLDTKQIASWITAAVGAVSDTQARCVVVSAQTTLSGEPLLEDLIAFCETLSEMFRRLVTNDGQKTAIIEAVMEGGTRLAFTVPWKCTDGKPGRKSLLESLRLLLTGQGTAHAPGQSARAIYTFWLAYPCRRSFCFNEKGATLVLSESGLVLQLCAVDGQTKVSFGLKEKGS